MLAVLSPQAKPDWYRGAAALRGIEFTEGVLLHFNNFAWIAVLAAASAPACALAQDLATQAEPSLAGMIMGFTYYNKPGGDLKAHHANVAECAVEGARTLSVDEQIGLGSSGGLIGGAFEKASKRGAAASGLENCMVVRGWRVVKLSDDEGQSLAMLAPADLATHLAPWVGADEPHGQIVRIWGNDATNAAYKRVSTRPRHTNNGQLSLKAATAADLHQFTPVAEEREARRAVIDAKWPKKALQADKLSLAPEGSAILIVQIKGLSFRNGIGVLLNRVGPDGDTSPALSDHGTEQVAATKGLLTARKEGDMFAFAVPPGHWRLNGLAAPFLLSFCLGAPSFEVKAGEAVYAGSFDLSAADMGPDMDLAVVKSWLLGQPQAETVQPAVYSNGSRSVCGGTAIYAMEVKGAPFEPGYTWGSALSTNLAAKVAAPSPTR